MSQKWGLNLNTLTCIYMSIGSIIHMNILVPSCRTISYYNIYKMSGVHVIIIGYIYKRYQNWFQVVGSHRLIGISHTVHANRSDDVLIMTYTFGRVR